MKQDTAHWQAIKIVFSAWYEVSGESGSLADDISGKLHRILKYLHNPANWSDAKYSR